MDHLTALSALSPERKAMLAQRSDRAGLIHLAGYLTALAICTSLIAAQGPLWGIFVLPQGILLVFLFTLSHECTHATPFRSGWINTTLGHAISPLILLPFTWFRYFHLAHHKHTNDPKNDPEIAGHPRPDAWGDYAVYLSGWRYWSGNAATLWRNAFGRIEAPYLPPRKHRLIRAEARALFAVYALVLASLPMVPILLWLWIIPVLIGQPVLRLYLLAEHGHCPPVANMLENTRTTFTNRLVRALAWNMPFHAEHHSLPNVPFHKLPDLHDDLAPYLLSTSDSYTRFTGQYVQGLARSTSRPPPAP